MHLDLVLPHFAEERHSGVMTTHLRALTLITFLINVRVIAISIVWACGESHLMESEECTEEDNHPEAVKDHLLRNYGTGCIFFSALPA